MIRVAVTLVVLVAVFLLGGGWYFSDQIRSKALEVHPAVNELTVEVVSASSTSVTLIETGDEENPLRQDAVYGLAWSTGYGQISGAADVTGDEVTRRVVVLSGSAPTPGQAATLERDAFPADPTIALDGPVREVTYSSPVGEFPAWFVPGDDTTWAILLHGQRAPREEVFRRTAKQIAGARFDLDWDELDYLDDSDWLTVPTLVVHGDDDPTNPLSTSQELAEDHTDLATLVVVPGAAHGTSRNAAPTAYDQNMRNFLTRFVS